MAQVATAPVGERRKLPLLDPHPRIGMPPYAALNRLPARPRTLPAASVRPLLEPGSSRTRQDAPATSVERDTAVVIAESLSPPHPPVQAQSPPSRKSRAFFDVVLGRTPVNGEPPTKPTPPSPPLELLATKHSTRKKALKDARPNYKEDTTDDDDNDESGDETSDESSDEDEPALSRTGVFIMQGGRKALEPLIPTSDIRGTSPDTSCEETRRLFETEYSTHKKRTVKRRARRSTAGSSTRPPKPKVEAVRKSTRLATRPATPIDADCSATDISVVGSTRSASVASTRNPTPKLKAKPTKPKSTPRPRPSPDLEQLAPQPTSIAHPPEDPPPPAPTHVVPLRPGYNAYTEADKLWFFKFLVWVFRQNAHAGKAEICQDIFQQAPHHRLESWKSYWRDHISDVEECRNSARRKQSNRALGQEPAPIRTFKGEQPATSRARPPPSSVTSSESMNTSVRTAGTFYDTIKFGGRRAHAMSEEPTAMLGASKTELIVMAEWASQELGLEGAFEALATQGRHTARQWRQIYLANRTFVNAEMDRIRGNDARSAATTLLSMHSPPHKRKVYETTMEATRPSQPSKRPRC
ncbi:hypothetical protein BDV93DRAFT_543626 [Ceratobasidium sp. AG-I]|nr:hypothetical protein BDV93DRAFT_543626 [Ceratobasidium sp. AG-I]